MQLLIGTLIGTLSTLRAIALVMGLLAATPSGAASIDDHVWFAADVEEAKGHLLASLEVYRTGKRIRADVHASHPVRELGHRLWGPVKKVDPALADRLQATLTATSKALEDTAARRPYEETVREAVAALDEAVRRVVPEPVRSSPVFQVKVIRKLLDLVVEEYEEAYSDGRIGLEDE